MSSPSKFLKISLVFPNRWREVLLLGAAIVAKAGPMIWLLVDALCFREPDDAENTEKDAWGALLAGQALAESANLQQIRPGTQRKLDRVKQWPVVILTEQLPKDKFFPVVERALAGNLLAMLGDPRSGVGLREDGLPDIEWCKVPGGTFLMGDDRKEASLPGFHISRYPVTNAQYRAFIDDGGYSEQWKRCWTDEGWKWQVEKNISEPDWEGGDFDLANHPVVGVSWYEATAYCV